MQRMLLQEESKREDAERDLNRLRGQLQSANQERGDLTQ